MGHNDEFPRYFGILHQADRALNFTTKHHALDSLGTEDTRANNLGNSDVINIKSQTLRLFRSNNNACLYKWIKYNKSAFRSNSNINSE